MDQHNPHAGHTVSPQVNLYHFNRNRFKEINANKPIYTPYCLGRHCQTYVQGIALHTWSIRPHSRVGWMSGRQGSHLSKHPLSCTFTQPSSHHCPHSLPRGFCFSLMCPSSWPSCRSKTYMQLWTTWCSFLSAGEGSWEGKKLWNKERTEPPLLVWKREKPTGYLKNQCCAPALCY